MKIPTTLTKYNNLHLDDRIPVKKNMHSLFALICNIYVYVLPS